MLERRIWIEATEYGARLFRSDAQVPWQQPAALASLYGQIAKLLRPTMLAVPLGELLTHWIRSDPVLREEMAEKSRALWPLRTALSDSGIRAGIRRTLEAIRATTPGVDISLFTPPPGVLAATAFRLAHGEKRDDFDADSASVFVVEFLRELGEVAIKDLIIDLRGEGLEPNLVSAIRTLRNTARFYDWGYGLLGRLGEELEDEIECDFVVPEPQPLLPGGVDLTFSFRGPMFARIAQDAEPEQVTRALNSLKPGAFL